MAGPVLVLLVLDGFGALKGMWRMVVVVDLAFRAYPFASTAVGALGGFVTGSGTSSSVLFGRLQVDTAVAISVSPQLLAAANIMGAGIGKMICPQSIAIGSAAAPDLAPCALRYGIIRSVAEAFDTTNGSSRQWKSR